MVRINHFTAKSPFSLALLFVALMVLPVAAADPVQLTAHRVSDGSAPQIDGKVADDAWLNVEPHATFTQTDPNEGAPATERTEERVLFDKTHLYIGVICFDREPGKIVVSQSRRDADITESDAVILVLDTFNDSQNAFVFGTNPLGIEYDGQVSSEGQTSGTAQPGSGSSGSQRGTISAFNANWDGDWRGKASITERGWEAEIAIPFKTRRYATGSGRTWGFNLKRNIRRKNEQVFLSPVDRGSDVYRVSSAAKLTGLELPPRRDLKLTPFALASSNKDYTVASDQVDAKATAGLDVKWGVRPNLTADFTVNTDFAQVEADEEQVNLTPVFRHARLDAPERGHALRQLPHGPGPGEGELRLQHAGQRAGAGAVQQSDVASLVEHQAGRAESQRHRPLWVYNDRRDTTDFNPYETLGRSFIVKYTRLVDF